MFLLGYFKNEPNMMGLQSFRAYNHSQPKIMRALQANFPNLNGYTFFFRLGRAWLMEKL